MTIIKTHLPLNTHDIESLEDYIKYIESATLDQNPTEFIKAQIRSSQDVGFLKYKRMMKPNFKLVKMGGSSRPRVEFAIIRTIDNKRMKLIRTCPNLTLGKGMIYKLIFPDSSYYESRFGRGRFMVYKTIDVVDTLTTKYDQLHLESPPIRQSSSSPIKQSSIRKSSISPIRKNSISRQNSFSTIDTTDTSDTDMSLGLSPVTSEDTVERLQVLSLGGKEVEYGTCSSAKTVIM